MTHLDTKRHPWTVFVLPKMCYQSHKCVTSYEQTSKTVLRQEEKGHKRCGRAVEIVIAYSAKGLISIQV